MLPSALTPFPAPGFSVMRGIQQVILVPNPPAGQDWSFTVEQGYYWRLNTAFMVLSASAVVGNRLVRPRILNSDGAVVWQGGNGQSFTANGIFVIGWARLGVNQTAAGTGPPNQIFTPDVWMPPSWRVIPSTLNLDTTANTGDQWSQVALWFDCIDPETLAHHQAKEQAHA